MNNDVELPGSEPREVVFDPKDDRKAVDDTTITPFSSVCRIRAFGGESNTVTSFGTGWIVDPLTVITAGHVVFKSKFSSGGSKCAKKVLVFPAYDEQAGIVEVYEASKIVVHDEFKRDRKKVEYDIAAIHLAVPLDPIFTPVDYEPVQDSQLSGSKARIAGYPRDLDNGEKMYTAEGPIVGVGTQLITHHVDTEKGQSGAPMWVSSASGADVVTGVHVRGFMSEAVNTSVRIDQAVKQWIHNQTLRMS